jgi:hypothetical protein
MAAYPLRAPMSASAARTTELRRMGSAVWAGAAGDRPASGQRPPTRRWRLTGPAALRGFPLAAGVFSPSRLWGYRGPHELQYPLQRDPHPVRAVLQFIPELVHRPGEHIGVQ